MSYDPQTESMIICLYAHLRVYLFCIARYFYSRFVWTIYAFCLSLSRWIVTPLTLNKFYRPFCPFKWCHRQHYSKQSPQKQANCSSASECQFFFCNDFASWMQQCFYYVPTDYTTNGPSCSVVTFFVQRAQSAKCALFDFLYGRRHICGEKQMNFSVIIAACFICYWRVNAMATLAFMINFLNSALSPPSQPTRKTEMWYVNNGVSERNHAMLTD